MGSTPQERGWTNDVSLKRIAVCCLVFAAGTGLAAGADDAVDTVTLTRQQWEWATSLTRRGAYVEFGWDRPDLVTAEDDSTRNRIVAIKFDPFWTHDETLAALDVFPHVKELDLRHCFFISDKGIEQISKHPSVESVLLMWNSSDYAGLTEWRLQPGKRYVAQLTDRSLQSFGAMKNLHTLYVAGNPGMSEEGLTRLLTKQKKLHRLVVSDDQLSAGGYERLTRLFPDCSITRKTRAARLQSDLTEPSGAER